MYGDRYCTGRRRNIKLIFIRHFSTAGNEKRQYIGRTDEAITEQARKIYLREPFHYPDVRQVVASPMKRCVQTAKLLYPMKKIWTQELLRECDFGEFEGRTYEELKEDSRYIQWMESGRHTSLSGRRVTGGVLRKMCGRI